MLTTALRVLLSRSFQPFIFTNQYEKQLDFMDLENLGLYVHIPFCRSICAFCPYCKVPYEEALAQQYKNALLKEIDLVCGQMKQKKQVTSLYFGGGTPALLVKDLGEIIHKLQQYFEIANGIGVELHPDDITPENLTLLQQAGVTMLSVGVQSFQLACLEKIGRKQEQIEEKITLIKQFQFSVVDIDLIFAIPGQNESLLQADIEKAFVLGATQISTYPFIDFSFSANPYPPLSKKRKKQMLDALRKVCEERGLRRTAVWTFAQPNTKRYSSVTRDCFLGFGVSATTLLRQSFKINTFSIPAYIERIETGKLPTCLTISFTLRQRALYFLFWSAYSLEINGEKFKKILGIPLEKMFGWEFWFAQKLGLLVLENGNYYLTEKAAMIYHEIEQRYTHAYIDKMWRLCRLEPFPEKMILK